VAGRQKGWRVAGNGILQMFLLPAAKVLWRQSIHEGLRGPSVAEGKVCDGSAAGAGTKPVSR